MSNDNYDNYYDNQSDKYIVDRFDDLVSRLDATQRAEASICQMLSHLVHEVHYLKQHQAADDLEKRWA